MIERIINFFKGMNLAVFVSGAIIFAWSIDLMSKEYKENAIIKADINIEIIPSISL